jgi:hypothetical protein
MERKDITKKISRLQEKIKSNLFFKGDTSSETNKSTKEVKQELEFNKEETDLVELYEKLSLLNVLIDMLNKGITNELVKLRILDSRIAFTLDLRKEFLNKNERQLYYTDDAGKFCSPTSIELIDATLERLEKERREIDKIVQKYNWTTDVPV